MIKIFEELGFVSIENGILSAATNPPHQEISESSIYTAFNETVKQQAFWALSPIAEIYDFLKNRK
jgi:single-stranded-DNA-specific exonuclease